MLSIEQSEYFGLMTLLAGLKVLIHHHQTPPLVAQLGFSVGPGTSTFAAIRKEEVSKMSSGLNFQEVVTDIQWSILRIFINLDFTSSINLIYKLSSMLSWYRQLT